MSKPSAGLIHTEIHRVLAAGKEEALNVSRALTNRHTRNIQPRKKARQVGRKAKAGRKGGVGELKGREDWGGTCPGAPGMGAQGPCSAAESRKTQT